MSSQGVGVHSTPAFASLSDALGEENWYAIRTMPRHEKQIVGQLQGKRVHTFLPMLQEIHRWSDRQSKIDVPMFSCYAFVRIVQTAEERLRVLRTPGVLGFVGNERQGSPIPDEQIESLRKAINEKIPCLPHPFINFGQRVRIRGGSLNGMVGILEGKGSDQSLIVSVELLQRSVSIRVEGYHIELV